MYMLLFTIQFYHYHFYLFVKIEMNFEEGWHCSPYRNMIVPRKITMNDNNKNIGSDQHQLYGS